jgi:hypothetical protein
LSAAVAKLIQQNVSSLDADRALNVIPSLPAIPAASTLACHGNSTKLSSEHAVAGCFDIAASPLQRGHSPSSQIEATDLT